VVWPSVSMYEIPSWTVWPGWTSMAAVEVAPALRDARQLLSLTLDLARPARSPVIAFSTSLALSSGPRWRTG
jgi:hypothetical protein